MHLDLKRADFVFGLGDKSSKVFIDFGSTVAAGSALMEFVGSPF